MNTKIIRTYISFLVASCLTFSSCNDNQPFNYVCGPEIELDIEVKNFSICLMDFGHIKLKPLTGTPPFTYFWSNGHTPFFSAPTPTSLWYKEYTTQNRYELWHGSYFVTVTDAKGGYAAKEIKVIRDRQINLIIDEKNNTTREDFCDGSITISPQGKDVKKYSVEYIVVGPNNYGNLSKTLGGIELKNLCKGNYRLNARLSYCSGEVDFTIE